MDDDARGDRLRLSTKLSLLFAGACIALFHGFNAYVYWMERKSCAPHPENA
jgi:hypothetical protein